METLSEMLTAREDARPEQVETVATDVAAPEIPTGPSLSEPSPEITSQPSAPAEKMVSLAALQEERRARQELQARLRQLEQAQAKPQEPAPEFWTDPEQAVDYRVRPHVDEVKSLIMANARMVAEALHGSDKVQAAIQAFDDALFSDRLDPFERQRVMSSPNPFAAAIEWHKSKSVLNETGGDLDAYRKKIEAEILARLQSEGTLPPSASRVTAAALPSDFSTVRNVQARGEAVSEGPVELTSIFKRK